MNRRDGPDLKMLEAAVGYRFHDSAFLKRALTHSSTGHENYERLEFLGDRVLGLTVADILYATFPEENEGGMARRHAALVCTEILAEIGRAIRLEDFVILSDGERVAGGLKQDNLMADAMEALIGAVYLDAGFSACKELIARLWGDRVTRLQNPPIDAKTALQEWAQARKLPPPDYRILKKDGPDHAPIFEIAAVISGHGEKTATGPSRRVAEKNAAQLLLAELEGRTS